MKQAWHVQVADSDGAPIEDAVVALQPASFFDALKLPYPYAAATATHEHQGGGLYVADVLAPSAEPWLLVVQQPDMSPVVQPLELRANASGELSASPPLSRLAATVTFSVETIESTAGEKIRRTLLTVRMFPKSEVVFLSGTEYHSAGTRFLEFALGRRGALFREKKIDAGTLVTIFSCDNRGFGTFVKAHRGWVDVRPLPAPPDGIVPGRAHVKETSRRAELGETLVDAGALSITDFYRYLSSVGTQRPGTVKEASIFSHCWEGGPVLYDTYELERGTLDTDPDPAPRPERFEIDLDGRIKDFFPENVNAANGWPNMKAAFADDGSVHIWGCNAVREYRLAIREAERNKSKGDDAFFVYTQTEAAYLRLEKRITRKFLVGYLFRRFADPERTYLAAAAKFFDKPVFGSPPGAGSEFAMHKGLSVMRIETSEWGELYAYYKQHFGPEFTPSKGDFDEGYVDFTKIAGRSAPDEPAFDPKFYVCIAQLPRKKTRLQFYDLYAVQLDGTDFRLTSDTLSGSGPHGQRYIMHNADKTKELAFLVTAERKVFRLTAGSDGKHSVVGEQLVPPP